MDLEIVVDESTPQHVVFTSLTITGEVRVTVSSKVEPKILAALHPDIAAEVVAAIEAKPA
jgi:hypothetical protein